MKKFPILVLERINLSVQLKETHYIIKPQCSDLFSSTLSTHVELASRDLCLRLCACVCVERGGQGVGGGGGTNYLSRRVQNGKPLVTCVKDESISPTAKITWCLQKVQRENRGRKWGWWKKGGEGAVKH